MNCGSFTKGIIDEDRDLYVVSSKTTKLYVASDATNFFGTTRKGTFKNVISIEGLDKLEWSDVEDMTALFNNAESIETLDISALNTSKVRNMSYMFKGMKKIETIYVDEFDISQVRIDSDMFEGAINIVGGEGTTYDKEHIDRSYARVDKKRTNNLPGYFTKVGSVKAYERLEYNIYWELGENADWKAGYDYPRYYVYGEGMATLPTKSNVERKGYELNKWTLEDGQVIESITREQKGSLTIYASWDIASEEPVTIEYVDLPEEIISNKDEGSFRTTNRLAKEVIQPTRDSWIRELKLGEYAGKIVDIGTNVDVTGLKEVKIKKYRSDYRRKVTFDSYAISAHKDGEDTMYAVNEWDLIRESEIQAEIWYDEVKDEYKVRLLNSNGEWRVRANGIDIMHEVEWDLTYIDIASQDGGLEMYDIDWMLNGGRWNPNYARFNRYEYGKETALPKDGDVIRDGYKFTTWKLDNGVEIATISSTVRRKLRLWANWKLNRFNARLDANGGQFDDKSSVRNVEIDGGSLIMFTEPSRKGYKFAGWTVKENGVTKELGDYWNYESGKTVTAVWKPINYTVIFDGNGADNPYAMASWSMAMVYGVAKETPENLFVRDGYTFTWWSSENGAIVFDRRSISTIGDYEGQVVVLRAAWTPKVIEGTFIYKKAAGGNEVAKRDLYYGNLMSFASIMDYIQDEYDNAGGKNKYKVHSVANEEGKIMYLREADVFDSTTEPYKATASYTFRSIKERDIVMNADGSLKTVRFDGNGGLVAGLPIADIPISAQYHRFEDIEPQALRPGFDFDGWTVDNTDKFTYEDLVTKNKVATANWIPKSYRLRYSANTLSSSSSASYDEELTMGENSDKIIKSIEELGWEREGYEFKDWSTFMSGNIPGAVHVKPGDSYDAYEIVTRTQAGHQSTHNVYNYDTVLYAQWEAYKGKAKHIINGAANSPYDITYGEGDRLKENLKTREGYKFVGWAKKSDSNTVVYTDRESADTILLNENKASLSEIELYAVYEKNEDVVPVVYKGNGGTVNGNKAYAIYVKKSTGLKRIPAKKGEETTTDYIDKNGNPVEFGKPLTGPTIIYADFGKGIQNETVDVALSGNNDSAIIRNIRLSNRELDLLFELYGVNKGNEVAIIGENDEIEKALKKDSSETPKTEEPKIEEKKTNDPKSDSTIKTDNLDKSEEAEAETDSDKPNTIAQSQTNGKTSVKNYVSNTTKGGGGGGSSGGGGGGAKKEGIQVAQNANAMPLINTSVTENRPINPLITPVNTLNLDIKSVVDNGVQWEKDNATGKYKLLGFDKDNKEVKPVNTFCQIIGEKATNTYYFDKDGYMLTGWMKTSDGKWYYFNEVKDSNEGKMAQGWTKVGNSWYYFNLNGSLLEQGTTPDGEIIGADGKWVQQSTNDNQTTIIKEENNKEKSKEEVPTTDKTAVIENNSTTEEIQYVKKKLWACNKYLTNQTEAIIIHTGENRFI